MHLVTSEGDRLVFHLGRREGALFIRVLQHYPLVPEAHFKVTKSTESTAGSKLAGTQKLLAEAAAAQRKENRRELDAWLNNSGTFTPQENGVHLTLTRGQVEWLFQLLNDVRVGSWLLLGSPVPEDGKLTVSNKTQERRAVTMELAGYFEARLLEALDARPGTP